MQSYPLLMTPTIADPVHVSDVLYVLRFIQVTKPIISSWIIRFQVEHTNNIVALTVFMFIQNVSVEQTKFQYNKAPFQTETWPSFSQLTFITVDNVKSFTQALTYLTHLLTATEFEKVYVHRFTSLGRYIWHFLSKNWMLQRCLRSNSDVLPLFTISTLSNNDVIHGVPGYFKCR